MKLSVVSLMPTMWRQIEDIFKERLGLKRDWNPQEDKNQSCFASLLGKGDKGDSLNVKEGEVAMGEVSEVSESLKVFSRVIWL